MLTKYQSNRLENVQKRCLKMMFGYDKNYSELLQLSGLQTLESRRALALVKFASNAAKNENYRHLFPLNVSERFTRKPKKFVEKFAKTDRLHNSPLYAMRRALNNTPYHDRFNSPNYVDLSCLFNDPFTN